MIGRLAVFRSGFMSATSASTAQRADFLAPVLLVFSLAAWGLVFLGTALFVGIPSSASPA